MSFSNCSSDMTFISKASALDSFEPAPGPARRKLVFLLTLEKPFHQVPRFWSLPHLWCTARDFQLEQIFYLLGEVRFD